MQNIAQRSSASLKRSLRLWDQASTLGVWENNFKGEKRKEKKHRLEPSHAYILSSIINHPLYRANSSLWEVSDSLESSLQDKLWSGSLNLWPLIPVCFVCERVWLLCSGWPWTTASTSLKHWDYRSTPPTPESWLTQLSPPLSLLCSKHLECLKMVILSPGSLLFPDW